MIQISNQNSFPCTCNLFIKKLSNETQISNNPPPPKKILCKRTAFFKFEENIDDLEINFTNQEDGCLNDANFILLYEKRSKNVEGNLNDLSMLKGSCFLLITNFSHVYLLNRHFVYTYVLL